MSISIRRNKDSDVVINMSDMFKPYETSDEAISKSRRLVKHVTSPFAKAMRFMGFNNEVKTNIELKDVNGDGITNISIYGTNDFKLRDCKGTVVGRSSTNNKGEVVDSNVYKLPAGEYSLEVLGDE